MAQIRRIMHLWTSSTGSNTVFLDPRADRDYFIKAILPWMVKYAMTIGKVNALKEPVVTYLRRFTRNESLIDIITQHFFHGTPAFRTQLLQPIPGLLLSSGGHRRTHN